MAQDRVLFIPWDRPDFGTFTTGHTEENRKASHHKRKVTVVCKDSV